MAIDTRKALADLAAMPGDIVAVPKSQMEALLTELGSRQSAPRGLSLFTVAAIGAASSGASA